MDVNGSLCERELSAERDKTWHECCSLGAVHQNHLVKVIAVNALLSFLKAPWLADCDVADPQTITWKRLLSFTILREPGVGWGLPRSPVSLCCSYSLNFFIS